ncbi:hypothetical protein CHS0354_017247 [Potamilus streckersoni]|uniref:Peptidase M12B domain-containing protein n=1 Tax=Potamilus streckersoni TaxID=2493646 RepID=A0AAE0VLM2_9BIVA|nr:hypothetical protein CHS0354_017247 [Potamilus streckersoni]
MTMNTGVFNLVLGLLAYHRLVTASLETVWLKDVNTRILNDEQTLCDPAFPNELNFHLQRGPDTIILNLKRNHAINPNADVYHVQKLENGRSALFKRQNLEMEDVGYYQDRENGAVMTVRNVKRSHDQCNRVINGNIQIGDRSYSLRPAEIHVASRSELDVPDLLGIQYVLQDQDHIDIQNSVPNKDSDATFSSRNIANLHSGEGTDQSRQPKKIYNVDVAVMIDSGLRDLFVSTVNSSLDEEERDKLVYGKIKQTYSHVINGVDLLFKKIEDPDISITITLSGFIVFKTQDEFPHKASNVKIENGRQYIEILNYLKDLCEWGIYEGINYIPAFDHVMLFTRYHLYVTSFTNTMGGLTTKGGVCGSCGATSIVTAGDFPSMVRTAAHELGRNLGADYDGQGSAVDCKAEDSYIMTPIIPEVRSDSRNSYIFSNCSVQAFKETLEDKECVSNKGRPYHVADYIQFVKKQPGEAYTLDEQCELILGAGSVNCEFVAADVCRSMRCTDPETNICVDKTFSAASGTLCGQNKWCIEENCVSQTLEHQALQ